MIDILGHDIDWRPLRAGDEVVQLEAHDEWARQWSGEVFTITGADPDEPGWMMTSIPSLIVEGPDVRKLHDDHRPADESFGEMMGKFTNNRVEATNDQ